MTGNVSFGDNNRSIFGAGSDLQLYHDGVNSQITNSGGYLDISNTTVGSSIRILGSGESLAEFSDDGDVDLFYNGVLKFSTTTTGVNVVGTAEVDTLKFSDNTTQTSAGASTGKAIAMAIVFG